VAQDVLPNFFAIIPAGGSGSRLWPLSRADQPKFLHDLTGNGQTLLRNTFDRLVPLTGADNIVVVTGQSHAAQVHAQLPDLVSGNVVKEPSPRESTAAIGLAAALIEARSPGAVVGSFAADHVITDVDSFHQAVREGFEAAGDDRLVTIGMTPTEPSSAFGYVEVGDALALSGAPSARVATRFVEKPDWTRAKEYVESGRFLWNAGMFIAKAGLVLDLIHRHSPELGASITHLAETLLSGSGELDPEVWAGLEKIAFDYSVAEPAADQGLMAVIPGTFGWDDVGDFAALARLHGGLSDLAILGKNRKVLTDQASGIVVSESDRLVSLIGVSDIVVVDTPDALLVTTKENAQRVKALVDMLRLGGSEDLL
jgi:mannose-1-phosphate guanylyltransferase